MSRVERVTVTLTAPMADSMRAAVAGGEYATTSEVIRDALRLWEARREIRTKELAALRRAWDEGKASGEPAPLDIDAIIATARATQRG